MNRGVLVAIAIAVAAAAGFLVQRQLQPSQVASALPSVATTEPTEASVAKGAPAQKIPEVLPHFLLADQDGQKRSLQEWSGRPVMVNFWATWCAPCRREIPLLNQLRAKHSAQRLEIVGIAVDFRDDVLKYAQTTPINYPLLIGEEDGMEAMKAFGMEGAGFPFTFFADSKQRIVAMRLGELHQDQADLILEKLMAVDAGMLDLKAAQNDITEGMKQIQIRRNAAEAAGKTAKTP
jgi:thiol-disulfide isomerase/thioredoxin